MSFAGIVASSLGQVNKELGQKVDNTIKDSLRNFCHANPKSEICWVFMKNTLFRMYKGHICMRQCFILLAHSSTHGMLDYYVHLFQQSFWSRIDNMRAPYTREQITMLHGPCICILEVSRLFSSYLRVQ